MEYLLAVIIGIGLAAACGLRAFVPVLGLALAAKAGWITLGESFAWLASWPAIIGLSIATLAEVSASAIPLLAQGLDILKTPVACAAGGLVLLSQVGGVGPEVIDVHPLLEWSAALITGGGVAGAVHAASSALRAGVTSVTAGVAAPVYSAFETITSGVASLIAFLLPILFAIVTVLMFVLGVVAVVLFVRRRRRAHTTVST